MSSRRSTPDEQPARRRQPDPIVTERLAIVGLGGSLARASRSLAALRVALDGAAEAGAATTLLNLRELDLPMYDPDDAVELPPATAGSAH